MAMAVFLPAVLGYATARAATQGPVQPQSQPDVRSHAFYILDESDATVLAARHEHVPVPIASITKLMTALVVLEAGQPMDEMLAITADDVRGTPGSHSRLAPGARLSREDLLRLGLARPEGNGHVTGLQGLPVVAGVREVVGNLTVCPAIVCPQVFEDVDAVAGELE